MVDFAILLAHQRGQCGGDCFVCRKEKKEAKVGLEDLDKLDAGWDGAQPAKPGGEFTVIPEDTEVYVVVSDQKPAIVGEKQTAVCKVTFEVVAPADWAGKPIWHDFWLTAKNLPYLKRDLGMLGWQGKPSQLLENEDSSLVTLGAKVRVGVEQYQAKDKQSGQLLYTVVDGQQVPTMRTKNTIKYFDEPYKHAFPGGEGAPAGDEGAPDTASPPGTPPTRGSAAGAQAPQPAADDDIPF